MPVRALIFDVDGTLAETEELHRAAFNAAFAEAGLRWFWTEGLYARLLEVPGGRERMAAYADETRSAPVDIPTLHRRKTGIYNERIRSGDIALRPGVERLIRKAREDGVTLAIATTTSRANVISLLAATLGEGALSWFASMRTGEDVRRKKPDPEVFRLVLADIEMDGADCIAFEDSANGLRAALAAGIPTIVTPSVYTRGDDFAGAALVLRDLDEPDDPWAAMHWIATDRSLRGYSLIDGHDDCARSDQADADPGKWRKLLAEEDGREDRDEHHAELVDGRDLGSIAELQRPEVAKP